MVIFLIRNQGGINRPATIRLYLARTGPLLVNASGLLSGMLAGVKHMLHTNELIERRQAFASRRTHFPRVHPPASGENTSTAEQKNTKGK